MTRACGQVAVALPTIRQKAVAMLALAWLAVTRASLADDRPVTSSTPVAGHDGATATRKEPATPTTSDNDSKITKCGWSISQPPRRTGSAIPLSDPVNVRDQRTSRTLT